MTGSAPAGGSATHAGDTRMVTGWGRCTRSVAHMVQVTSVEDVSHAVTNAGVRGVVARGAGRSYGDASQNGGGSLLDLSALNQARLSSDGALVTVGAGLRLDDLMRWLLPQGLMVPVSPGTGRVTIGGMIAADVHGKNHHVDGSFGSHVASLDLIDGRGEQRRLNPEQPEFWATVGGMGLTGVITSVAFRPLRVETAYAVVNVERFARLQALMDAMREQDRRRRYTVAWLDNVGTGGPVGRGILATGDNAAIGDLDPSRMGDPLRLSQDRALTAPRTVPSGLLNRASVGAFNAAWFAWEGRPRTGEIQHLTRFFHPLDRVERWNHIYGRKGFIQYQFVVPDNAGSVVEEVLAALHRAGAPSFLTVLKRFGEGNPGPLSFPMPGWTLALDLPAAGSGLKDVLPALDRMVVEAGGRFYLAKDAHASPSFFAKGYPRLDEWRRCRDTLDPERRFVSDLARRLELVPPG